MFSSWSGEKGTDNNDKRSTWTDQNQYTRGEERQKKLNTERERRCVCFVCKKGVWVTSRTNFNNMSLCRVLTIQLPHWMLMSLLPRQQDSLRGHEVIWGVGWCGRSVFVCLGQQKKGGAAQMPFLFGLKRAAATQSHIRATLSAFVCWPCLWFCTFLAQLKLTFRYSFCVW